jgi:hypothetical protein
MVHSGRGARQGVQSVRSGYTPDKNAIARRLDAFPGDALMCDVFLHRPCVHHVMCVSVTRDRRHARRRGDQRS